MSYRNGASDTSVAAAQSMDMTAMEALVLSVILEFGQDGCIQDQVLDRLSGYAYSSVTARFRALLDRNAIVDTGARRPGYSGRKQRVLRAAA